MMAVVLELHSLIQERTALSLPADLHLLKPVLHVVVVLIYVPPNSARPLSGHNYANNNLPSSEVGTFY